jgi:hypothetical protein
MIIYCSFCKYTGPNGSSGDITLLRKYLWGFKERGALQPKITVSVGAIL